MIMEAQEWIVFVLLAASLLAVVEAKNPRSYMSGDRTSFTTPDEKHFQGVTLHMMERTTLTFSVRTCWDAHIYLQNDLSFSTSTEIIIGGWKNYKSAIRLFPGTQNQTEALKINTPGIVSCEEYRRFWVSWRNDTVLVGRGPVYGQQLLITFDRRAANYYYPINVVKFAAGWQAVAVWRIQENAAESMWYRTPAYYQYVNVWKTAKYMNNFFTFEVAACAHAHIALAEQEGVFRDQAHEIVIGGWDNKKSVIRWTLQESDPRFVYDQEGVLECNIYRVFWISWKNNTIKVGRGSVYDKNIFMQWDAWREGKQLRPVQALGFSSGWDVTADWWFYEDRENTYTVYEPKAAQSQVAYVLTPRQNLFNVYIQSCFDATLLISSKADPSGNEGFRLVLGADSNQRTYVRKYGDNTDLASASTNGVLECDRWMPFWLSWSPDGTITVGKWRIANSSPLLSWRSGYKRIGSIGFDSPNANKPSNFRVRANQAENVVIGTKNNFTGNFLTVHQQYYKAVRIKACNPVFITLTPEDGVIGNSSYQIIIGYNNNQETAIWQPQQGVGTMIKQSTPDILSCDEFRSFWIGWINNALSVGRGWTYGAGPILPTDPNMPFLLDYQLQSINVQSSPFYDAQWIFDEDLGDVIQINTTSAVYQWFRYGNQSYQQTPPPWLFFTVQGCSEAQIALARDYHNNPLSMYEIVLGASSNSKVFIRKGINSNNQVEADVSDLLSCDQPRDFWVSWEDGIIQVGQTKVRGQDVVATWVDPDPHGVEAIGVSSGKGAAQWQFSERDMVESTINLASSMGYQQFWITARHRQVLQFGITTCNKLHLALATIPGLTDVDRHYDVGIMATDDMKSFIKTGKRSEVKVQSNTPYVMNCEDERFIWITWLEGVINVGSGLVVGSKSFLSLQDLNSFQVSAIGFKTEAEKNARIRLLHKEMSFMDMNRALPPLSGTLLAGEIAGAVLGFMVLVGLFALGVYLVMKPPDVLKPIILGTSPTPGGQILNVDNPLQDSVRKSELESTTVENA